MGEYRSCCRDDRHQALDVKKSFEEEEVMAAETFEAIPMKVSGMMCSFCMMSIAMEVSL